MEDKSLLIVVVEVEVIVVDVMTLELLMVEVILVVTKTAGIVGWMTGMLTALKLGLVADSG